MRCQNFFKDETEDVLRSLCLGEQKSTPLVLHVEEDHRQLLQARLLYGIILLARLQDIVDVLNSERREIVVAIHKLQVSSNLARWLAEVNC